MFHVERRYFAGDLKLLCGTSIQAARTHFQVTHVYVKCGLPTGGTQAASDQMFGLALAYSYFSVPQSIR
jgi:hypothetical protein